MAFLYLIANPKNFLQNNFYINHNFINSKKHPPFKFKIQLIKVKFEYLLFLLIAFY